MKYLTDLLAANRVPESEARLGSSSALPLFVSRALSERRRASEAAAEAAADEGCRRRGLSDIVRTR